MNNAWWRGGRAWRSALVVAALAVVAGCGGGGGGDDNGGTNPGPGPFAVSVTVAGSGSVATASRNIDCGTVCSATVDNGTDLVLTATPAAGQELQAWGGACSSATGNTCTITISQATSVSATFRAASGGGSNNFGLAVAVTGTGRVTSAPAGIDCGTTCNATFAASTSVTLTAAPGAGQVLQAWGGDCTGTQNTCTLPMTIARNVTATFAASPPAGRAWGTAAPLENSNDFNVAGTNPFADVNVLTAIDPSGNALVLWQQSDGTPDGSTQKVFSRRYVAGQGWSAAVTVPGLQSSAVNFVTGRLVMDASGNATWIRHDFETRRYSTASGWSASAFTPANSAGGSLADVTVGADGTVHMLGVGGSVLYNRLAPGSSQWATWADVSQSTLEARRPQLALGAGGSVIAVWRERNPGDSNYSVKANRSVGGAWQAPVRIEELVTNVNDSALRIASDSAGNAVAAWHQGSSVYVSRFSGTTNTWGTPSELDAGQIGTTFGSRIQLAMAADGRAVVTWNSTFALRSASITAGGGVSTPVEVNSYNAGYFLGIDNNGRAVVTYRAPSQWPNPTDGTQNLYVRELPSGGGTWSAQVLLETGAGDVKDEPFCAMNANGEAACAWAQDDIANDTVRNSLWAAVRR